MSKLGRLKKLPGTVTTTKKPVVSDFEKLVKELQALTMAQQNSQAETVEAIKQLSKIVLSASKDGFDVGKVIDAISGLKEKIAEKDMSIRHIDYKIDFERDKFGLLKTGIHLKAVTPTLN